MRPEPEEISLTEYRRLTAAQPRQKRAKPARALSIPRADAEPRDGLRTCLQAGFSYSYYGGTSEHRFYECGGLRRDTGRQPTMADATAIVKAWLKEQNGCQS